MRLFVAINLPADVRQAVYDGAAPLREAAPHASWVAEANLHLTLKFLGEVADERARDVSDALGAVAVRHRATPLELTGFGTFPNLRRPRVVWAGVVPDPKLELIYHDVQVACEGLGYEVDGRPFKPHVTIGRLKPAPVPDDNRALARAVRSAQLHAACTVESVDVMRSELSQRGARYSAVATLPLAPLTPIGSA